MRRRALASALGAAVVALSLGATTVSLGATTAAAMPPIHHVFVIVEENESASATFAASSPAPYLADTLRSEGAFLPHYYGIGHESNDNYIAMISGQAPNPQNQGDCQVFDDFTPDTIGADGQAMGSGCVFPSDVKTIADQLGAAGLTWRDYDESMGADPAREAGECGHPGLNQRDGTQTASAADQYATRHDPFVYFHSIIDDTALCDSHVVNLDLLQQDLRTAATTPNFVFITPDLCDDGHDATCADKSRPGGFAGIDSFLKVWVPRITSSPAYRQENGLLAIIFDEASTSDTSSCCGEIPGPNSPQPGINGPGGGDTGAVLLSPCIKPGTVTDQAYNHYTLLRSVEDIFGLAHLGYAQLPGERSFGSDIFTGSCAAATGPGQVRLRAPSVASAATASARTIPVSWSAANGSVSAFTVQERRTSAPRSAWRTLLSATKRRSLRFAGALGATYAFRVRATGVSSWVTATTVVPSAARLPGGTYRGHWRAARVRDAWEGGAQIGYRGASFELAYTGGAVQVVADVWPQGGRARFSLGGIVKTVDLHSARPHARRIVFSAFVGAGRHRLRIVVLKGPVPIEGIAITNRSR